MFISDVQVNLSDICAGSMCVVLQFRYIKFDEYCVNRVRASNKFVHQPPSTDGLVFLICINKQRRTFYLFTDLGPSILKLVEKVTTLV